MQIVSQPNWDPEIIIKKGFVFKIREDIFITISVLIPKIRRHAVIDEFWFMFDLI